MRPEDAANSAIEYLEGLFTRTSQLQIKSIEYMKQSGKLGMSVSPLEAGMLGFFIEQISAKKVVELGCYAGFSALAMADSMAGGDLYTFEFNSDHALFSKKLFSEYTGSTNIHLIEGDARQTLNSIESASPFDLVFIDANKSAYFDYLLWAEAKLKKGGLIIGDNTLLYGELAKQKSDRVSNSQLKNMRKFNERLADKTKYSSCFIPTSEGMTVAKKIF